MKNTKIEDLIAKFISSSITETELDRLSDWLEKPGNEAIFKEYIRINYALDYNLSNFDTGKSRLMVLAKIQESDRKERRGPRILAFYKYAAAVAIAVVLSASLYYYNSTPSTDSPEVITNIEAPILPGTDKAVLTLEDGKQVVLEKGKAFNTNNVQSDGERIAYRTTEPSKKDIAYNYLTIPRGGQFYVELSDGTKVWLNSESKLKYPVTFKEGETRAVELLYGEAYFDVSHSSNHEGSRFSLSTRGQNVVVLGTEFNVKSYNGEDATLTTLVEGTVSVFNQDKSKILEPGQQSKTDSVTDDIHVQTVDVADVTAWKNGFFSFQRENLDDILTTLSRWYDTEVFFNNDSKKEITFSGVLKRTSNVEELLSNFEKTGRVNFEIKNKIILVK